MNNIHILLQQEQEQEQQEQYHYHYQRLLRVRSSSSGGGGGPAWVVWLIVALISLMLLTFYVIWPYYRYLQYKKNPLIKVKIINNSVHHVEIVSSTIAIEPIKNSSVSDKQTNKASTIYNDNDNDDEINKNNHKLIPQYKEKFFCCEDVINPTFIAFYTLGTEIKLNVTSGDQKNDKNQEDMEEKNGSSVGKTLTSFTVTGADVNDSFCCTLCCHFLYVYGSFATVMEDKTLAQENRNLKQLKQIYYT